MIFFIIEEGLNLTKEGWLFKKPKALSESRLTLPSWSAKTLKEEAKAKEPAGEGFLSERLNRFFGMTQVEKLGFLFYPATPRNKRGGICSRRTKTPAFRLESFIRVI